MRRLLLLVVALALVVPLALTPASAHLLGAVTIYRDAYGVPHIVGEDEEATAFGAGYVLGMDRLFETDVIRRLGQGRLSEVLGAGRDGNGNGIGDSLEADMAVRREFYDAADIEAQYQRLPARIKRLLVAFARGMNTAIAEQTANPAEASVVPPALGYTVEPWRPQDSVVVLMLFTIVTFAGEGAGGEAANAALLADLVQRHGGDVDAGLAAWEDLVLRNDPDAPAVVPHGEGPAEAFVSASTPSAAQIALALGAPEALAAAAKVEADLVDTITRALEGVPVPRVGSYALAATGSRTASGKGVLLGAPQAGFLAPAIFYEWGMHSPGSSCTGFTVPGLGPFTGIGWCNGHSWTFVAGNGGDQVDLYVETLCDDGAGYVYDADGDGPEAAACVPFEERVETYLTKSTVGGEPPATHTDVVRSTVHGPVIAQEGGKAFVFKRAQTGHFAHSFVGIHGLNTAQSLQDIVAATAETTATYNMTYADEDGNIAYFFTGFQPVRHAEIDHRLPTPGTGGFEWQARSLPPASRPHVINPSSEILHVNQGADSKPISWWPRPSGRFIGRVGHTAADREHFAGMTGLDIATLKAENRTIISDLDILTPRLDAIVSGALDGVDPSSALGQAYALYQSWRAAGYPRVDADGDGRLDDPALAIFAADYLNFERSPVWDKWIARVWSETGHGPRSSYLGALGQTVAAVEEPTLFSAPIASGWEADFRAALTDTLAELSARFGGAPMSSWSLPAPVTRFDAVGLLAPRTMKVVDHGSYSQIVDHGAQEGVNIMPPGNGRADRAADVALHEATGELPPHFVDQIELYEQFEFKPMRMRPSEYRTDVPWRVFAYPDILAAQTEP